MELPYSFIGLVYYPHGMKHWGTQVDVCWRRNSDLYNWTCRHQEEWGARTPIAMWMLKAPIQWHTCSNKAIPTPTKSHFLIEPHPMSFWGPITFELPLQSCGQYELQQAKAFHHCLLTCTGSRGELQICIEAASSIAVWLMPASECGGVSSKFAWEAASGMPYNAVF